MEELGGLQASQEERDKMRGILNRMSVQQEEQEEDSDDEEDPIDLSERLRGVNLDNTDEVWARLTEEEREQFSQLARAGDVSSVLPEFQPWWEQKPDSRKIRDLSEPEDEGYKAACPRLAGDIPEFSSLCGKPSEFIKFGIFNILYAYAYGVKFLLGDYEEETADFVYLVQLLSKNLSGHNYSDVDTALESAASEVNNHQDLIISLQFSREVKKDVIEIIRGPGVIGSENYYVLAALSDLRQMFSKTAKSLKKQDPIAPPQHLPAWLHTNNKPDLKLSEVKRNMKKIEFYLSWSQDHYPLLRSLVV